MGLISCVLCCAKIFSYNHMTTTCHCHIGPKGHISQIQYAWSLKETISKNQLRKRQMNAGGSLIWSNRLENISRTTAITVLCCSISFLLVFLSLSIILFAFVIRSPLLCIVFLAVLACCLYLAQFVE
jgi:hypothetical protein